MRVIWITIAVLVVDQITKLVVLHSMRLHESIPILGDWLRLTFTENPGMAFGITFGPPGLITIFSIVATVLIFGYLIHIRDAYLPYRASLAAILGGALGNIIDRVFYGWIFRGDDLFMGRVVDFIHVNFWRGVVDLPFMEPTYVALFPIWNVADMGIVLGVTGILVFQRRFHEELYAAQSAPAGEEAAEHGADAQEPVAEADAQPVPTYPQTASGEGREA